MAKIQSTKDSLKDRLGSDVKFPIVGDFQPVSGVNTLIQDIEQLLLTIPGERVNRPDFGCSLRNQIWENIAVAQKAGENSIKSALELFEPRITVNKVSSVINENTSLIVFTIDFTINNTDSNINLVFPFRTSTSLSFA